MDNNHWIESLKWHNYDIFTRRVKNMPILLSINEINTGGWDFNLRVVSLLLSSEMNLVAYWVPAPEMTHYLNVRYPHCTDNPSSKITFFFPAANKFSVEKICTPWLEKCANIFFSYFCCPKKTWLYFAIKCGYTIAVQGILGSFLDFPLKKLHFLGRNDQLITRIQIK